MPTEELDHPRCRILGGGGAVEILGGLAEAVGDSVAYAGLVPGVVDVLVDMPLHVLASGFHLF